MSGDGWRVEFSRSALKALGHLEAGFRSRILDRLEELGEANNPLGYKDVRALEGRLKSFFRLRVGDYRIIFELDSGGKRIGILAIVPRGKAYR